MGRDPGRPAKGGRPGFRALSPQWLPFLAGFALLLLAGCSAGGTDEPTMRSPVDNAGMHSAVSGHGRMKGKSTSSHPEMHEQKPPLNRHAKFARNRARAASAANPASRLGQPEPGPQNKNIESSRGLKRQAGTPTSGAPASENLEDPSASGASQTEPSNGGSNIAGSDHPGR